MNTKQLLEQLTFAPRVLRGTIESTVPVVIGAMGGSALAGDAFAYLNPHRQVLVHRDYGLPTHAPENAVYIAVSYSGNTEETLSFAKEVVSRGYVLGVVTSGGALSTFAQNHEAPTALVPDGLAPRNAFMYLVRALLSLTKCTDELTELASLSIDTNALNEEGEQDAHFFLHGVPLFYTSAKNAFFARLGMLIMDETARTPAFSNVFPELNHNEMQAFDVDMPEGIEHLFRMCIIRDESDHPRILKRMHLFEKLMRERKRTVRTLDIAHMSNAETVVHLWLRFLIAARFLAETRNINPDTEPLTEEFKSRL